MAIFGKNGEKLGKCIRNGKNVYGRNKKKGEIIFMITVEIEVEE